MPAPLRPRRCATLCALAAAMMAGPAPTVWAHTVLTASDPPADSVLSTGPSSVSATFSEELQPAFAAMTVVGPDGNLWNDAQPTVSGRVATVGVRPLGPSGVYAVNYRVTSADGHVVSGSWSFTVTVSTTAAPGPAPPEPVSPRTPLWPLAVAAVVAVAGAAAWSLRRRA